MIYIVEESINKMGGVERIISTLANSFFENKYPVKVISFYKDNKDPFFSYNLNIERIYLLNTCNSRTRSKLNYIKIIKEWKRVSKNIKSDDTIIFGRVSVAAKLLPFINNNCKIIVRDAINIYNHSNIVKLIMKCYFPRKVSTFIVSSEESINLYNIFFNGKYDKMIKIYNPLAVDVKKIEKYNFDNKIILSSGRFDNQKAFEVLIYAFEIVQKKYPDWKLRIVGDGKLKDEYLKIIELNNIKNIDIVSSSKRIEEELNKASIYVMTSRYEGYANALVEAAAFGLPIVSFNWLTGVEEIISNNENGLIVDLVNRNEYYNGKNNSIDIDNLSKAIIRLINNKNLCVDMSKNNKNILISRNKDKILEEWEKLIK